jgi:hypothetical protein
MTNRIFALDLNGQVFGRWHVKEFAYKKPTGEIYWHCICDCGVERAVKAASLRSGKSVSCGCYRIEKVSSHGYTATPTFYTWQSMKQRCNYEGAKSYKHYGGRGIEICERWLESFENFLADMGEKPAGTSLDRKDNNGPYSPDNCKWSTAEEQQLNKTNTRWITYEGETLALSDWARRYNTTPQLIFNRIHAGWSIHDALTKPIRACRSKN